MKVSVVIPAYNEEKYIGEALKHLNQQEVKADEIIVVDNNSADKTAQIAKKYGARVISEKIQGMIPARNRGLNQAQYEIIARNDADTRVPKDWIKRIKENFETDKDLIALSGPTHFYDFPFPNIFQNKQWMDKAVFALIRSQIKHPTLYGPNMAIRKSAWEKVKNLVCLDDGNVHEDIDLAIHLGNFGKIKIDQKLIVNISFRRWKNLYTYYKYPYKLFQTVKRHNLNNAKS